MQVARSRLLDLAFLLAAAIALVGGSFAAIAEGFEPKWIIVVLLSASAIWIPIRHLPRAGGRGPRFWSALTVLGLLQAAIVCCFSREFLELPTVAIVAISFLEAGFIYSVLLNTN